MNRKVLIFLSAFNKKDASMEEKNDFIIGQTFVSAECAELGTIFDYTQIPPDDVAGFIEGKIKEFKPLWVVGEGTSASALMKMNVPRRVLVNPSVGFDDQNNVSDHVRQTRPTGFSTMTMRRITTDFSLYSPTLPGIPNKR